jgi:hypothetical protein
MHEAELALAVLPEPPRLFRLKLLPYSIGHELHLYRRASPFFSLKQAEFDAMPYGRRFAATMQAVHVCHQGFEANCRPMRGWRLWAWLAKFCDLKKTTDAIRQHIWQAHGGYQAELPSYSGEQTGRIRILGAPEMHRMFLLVCDTLPDRELRLYGQGRRLTAWDYPLVLAHMHWQARAELDGRLKVFSRADESIEDEIARREKLREEQECPTP